MPSILSLATNQKAATLNDNDITNNTEILHTKPYLYNTTLYRVCTQGHIPMRIIDSLQTANMPL